MVQNFVWEDRQTDLADIEILPHLESHWSASGPGDYAVVMPRTWKLRMLTTSQKNGYLLVACIFTCKIQASIFSCNRFCTAHQWLCIVFTLKQGVHLQFQFVYSFVLQVKKKMLLISMQIRFALWKKLSDKSVNSSLTKGQNRRFSYFLLLLRMLRWQLSPKFIQKVDILSEHKPPLALKR